jgi:hypothetical protein
MLETEVLNEVHVVIAAKMEQIVLQLRDLGHNLKYYEGPIPGIIALRDYSAGNPEQYDLMLAIDSVVSVAFRGTSLTEVSDTDTES